jgi:hypothetical protein
MMKAETKFWHWWEQRYQFSMHIAQDTLSILDNGETPVFSCCVDGVWAAVLILNVASVFSASCGGCRRGTSETWIWCRLTGKWL